jgi:hypothetical protein
MELITNGINTLFFLSVIAFIVFLILLIVHYNYVTIFSFLPPKDNSSYSEAIINTQTRILNKEEKAAPEINGSHLEFNKITNFKYEKFTISFDVFLNGQHKTTVPPRVLMYYHTNPINILAPDSLTEDNLLTTFTNTNFLVYAEPVQNDLIVAVITKKDLIRVLEVAAVIKNIPINDPFQVTLVIGTYFIEVYKNKQLIKTYHYKGTLDTSSTVNTKLYSPIESIVGDTIKIGNVQYFDAAIRSDQLRVGTNTLKPKSFFT